MTLDLPRMPAPQTVSKMFEKVIQFSSLSVLPVLAFIAVYMFNGIDDVKKGQSEWVSHVKVLEQTLPYMNDAIKHDSRRIDSIDQELITRSQMPASPAKSPADARRDAEIKHLQDVIKELSAKLPEQHTENKPLEAAQTQLASLILN